MTKRLQTRTIEAARPSFSSYLYTEARYAGLFFDAYYYYYYCGTRYRPITN